MSKNYENVSDEALMMLTASLFVSLKKNRLPKIKDYLIENVIDVEDLWDISSKKVSELYTLPADTDRPDNLFVISPNSELLGLLDNDFEPAGSARNQILNGHNMPMTDTLQLRNVFETHNRNYDYEHFSESNYTRNATGTHIILYASANPLVDNRFDAYLCKVNLSEVECDETLIAQHQFTCLNDITLSDLTHIIKIETQSLLDEALTENMLRAGNILKEASRWLSPDTISSMIVSSLQTLPSNLGAMNGFQYGLLKVAKAIDDMNIERILADNSFIDSITYSISAKGPENSLVKVSTADNDYELTGYSFINIKNPDAPIQEIEGCSVSPMIIMNAITHHANATGSLSGKLNNTQQYANPNVKHIH